MLGPALGGEIWGIAKVLFPYIVISSGLLAIAAALLGLTYLTHT